MDRGGVFRGAHCLWNPAKIQATPYYGRHQHGKWLRRPAAWLEHGHPGVSEQFTEGNQGQPLQGGRIIADHAFEQCDSQPLTLEATGAVVGLFLIEVVGDFGVTQLPELDAEALHMDLFDAGIAPDQCNPGIKVDPAPSAGS